MTHYLLLILALSSALASAQGAEDDFVILNLDGNLIGPMEPIEERIANEQQATVIISAYHQLLSATVQVEVTILHEQILDLIPRFEIAFTAADSAEFSHLLSEMDLRLEAIQTIHAQHYTPDVRALLTAAYRSMLPTLGDEN